MLYESFKVLAKLVISSQFKVIIKGKENLSLDQPVVIASNHVSGYDPIVLSCVIDGEIHFLAKKELFKNRLLRWLLTNINAIPVDRHGGNVIRPVRKGLRVLNEGGLLGVFPEGTRCKSDQVVQPKKGVAFFSFKTATPVLPIYITYDQRRYRPIVKVNIGEAIDPIHYQDLDYSGFASLVMESVMELKSNPSNANDRTEVVFGENQQKGINDL
ncbi:lysophospholipid acyltransferase family protein [Alkalibacillus silvisoli]|uniref:Lysophospholipid acyltransferase family protein n=1 Tax=Alkalibacillus silvisoli TaxID=392823 RepID=A0ABP3JNM0_9BACI